MRQVRNNAKTKMAHVFSNLPATQHISMITAGLIFCIEDLTVFLPLLYFNILLPNNVAAAAC